MSSSMFNNPLNSKISPPPKSSILHLRYVNSAQLPTHLCDKQQLLPECPHFSHFCSAVSTVAPAITLSSNSAITPPRWRATHFFPNLCSFLFALQHRYEFTCVAFKNSFKLVSSCFSFAHCTKAIEEKMLLYVLGTNYRSAILYAIKLNRTIYFLFW